MLTRCLLSSGSERMLCYMSTTLKSKRYTDRVKSQTRIDISSIVTIFKLSTGKHAQSPILLVVPVEVARDVSALCSNFKNVSASRERPSGCGYLLLLTCFKFGDCLSDLMDGTTEFGQNNFERLYSIWAALACSNIMKTREVVTKLPSLLNLQICFTIAHSLSKLSHTTRWRKSKV